MFYVLAHKNKKFEKKLNHSKFIVSNASMFDKYSDVWMSFAYQLHHKLKKYFDEDLMLIVKKKLLSDVIFDTLPFCVYDHFFNCNRGFYVHNKCNFCNRFYVKEKALSNFLNEKLMFNYGLSPIVLVENFDFLENGIQFFLHYRGIIYKGRDKNFDNNYDKFGVIHYESVNSPSMLYKTYSEILCRKKVLPLILTDFDRKKVSRCRACSYCSGNDCLGSRRKKIISIFIKETYKKPKECSAQSLDIET